MIILKKGLNEIENKNQMEMADNLYFWHPYVALGAAKIISDQERKDKRNKMILAFKNKFKRQKEKKQ